MSRRSSDGTERLVIGWTCDDCDEAIGDEPRMWDLAEKLRKEHEEAGHTTTVEVVEEKRILPSQGDRMDIGERVIEIADAEIDWICPECHRSGEDLGTTRRCPDCDQRLREILPDGGSVEDGVDRCPECGEDFDGRQVLPPSEKANKRDDGKTVVAYFHGNQVCTRLLENINRSVHTGTNHSEGGDER